MIEWFEDLSAGMRFETGSTLVTEADIKEFATKYDPQPFHLDDAAGENSFFRGLTASGWHTASLAMKLMVEGRPFGAAPLIGLGVDNLRWMLPVRPGDILTVQGEIVELKLSSRKSQGIVHVKWTVHNQKGEAVCMFTPKVVVQCRPKAD